MRNPLKNAMLAVEYFRRLRAKGCFSRDDAFRQFYLVMLPSRIQSRLAARWVSKFSKICELPEGYEVLFGNPAVSFIWPRPPSGDVGHLLDTLLNPSNPHYYLAHPVRLRDCSTVVDVGACEGAFGLMCAKQYLSSHVTCFEPNPKMGILLEKSISRNQVSDRVELIRAACGRESGSVCFFEGGDAAGGRIESSADHGITVPQVTLDEFFKATGRSLTKHDLIKIDAEGSDIDVLLGAKTLIQNYGPQIAVTTYHEDSHADRAIALLQTLRSDYTIRLRGFSFWTETPRPVLLLAARNDLEV